MGMDLGAGSGLGLNRSASMLVSEHNDQVADIGGKQWCGCLSNVHSQYLSEQGHSLKIRESGSALEQLETPYVSGQRLLQICWQVEWVHGCMSHFCLFL